MFTAKLTTISTISIIGLLAAGCGGTESTLCQDAADHLSQCLGTVPDAATSCDAAMAADVLSMTCDEITAASTGKADFADLQCLFKQCGYTFWYQLVDQDGAPVPSRQVLIQDYTAYAQITNSAGRGGWEGLFYRKAYPVLVNPALEPAADSELQQVQWISCDTLTGVEPVAWDEENILEVTYQVQMDEDGAITSCEPVFAEE